jgi:signal transduction histidine kinase
LATGLICGHPPVRAELTQAIEIRSLSYEEAEAGLDVRIRGTVTFIEGPNAVFVQDETAGTFFRPAPGDELRPGAIVEVTGKTHAGRYLPGIALAPYQIIGYGPLPPAVPVGYDDLTGGRYHYQRVAIEGIVRSVVPDGEGRSVLRIAMGSAIVEARVDSGIEDESAIVDSRVRAEGLAAGGINRRRQLVQPYLRLRSNEEITVLRPAVPESEIPHVLAADLATFSLAGHENHRVKISGVVTARPSAFQMFIRSDGTPLGVRFSAPTLTEVGDHVEAVGFTEMDRFNATLVDARLLMRISGAPPVPRLIEIEEILAGASDADLVAVTAILTAFFRTSNGVTLSLEWGGRTLQARGPEMDHDLPLRSQVRVTGICQVESTTSVVLTSLPETVTLQVRSTDDIEVLRSPSWWTARRLVAALVTLAGAMLLAGLWIAVLRRQVRRQTEVLERRIKSEAVLEERQRIAREFHDSLEQDLTGLSLRLAAAATRALDEKGRQIIDVSCGLLARIRTETRNFVSDLRDSAENQGDLASALEVIAGQWDGADGVEVRVDFSGPLPVFPAAKCHHLRMIARESLANALKHARARRVMITVAADDGVLWMQITDDGQGFDPEVNTRGRSGHFGCVGMRERARKLGATIGWRSAPNQGTTVEVVMPFAGPSDGTAQSPSDHKDSKQPAASAKKTTSSPCPAPTQIR